MDKEIMYYVFIDTEFTDFINSDLISLGLVSEDGQRQFYVEISSFNRNYSSEFVRKVIYPLLNFDKYGKNSDEASLSLRKWLLELPGDNIIIVWDYMMDWYLFDNLLNVKKYGSLGRPLRNEIYSKAFNHRMHEMGLHSFSQLSVGHSTLIPAMEEYFEQPENFRHHALVDAKSNRYAWLKGIEEAKKI